MTVSICYDWIGIGLGLGLDWIGLVWIGLDWIGLDWIGMQCNAKEMNDLSSLVLSIINTHFFPFLSKYLFFASSIACFRLASAFESVVAVDFDFEAVAEMNDSD